MQNQPAVAASSPDRLRLAVIGAGLGSAPHFQSLEDLAATSPVHRMEGEDMAAVLLHYAGGAMGVVQATTAAYPGFSERIVNAALERSGH